MRADCRRRRTPVDEAVHFSDSLHAMKVSTTLASVLLGALIIVRVAAQGAAPAAATCDLTAYRTQAGLSAARSAGGVTVSWDGDAGVNMRARLAVEAGRPVIKEIAAITANGWTPILSNATPEFTVVSGLRRMTNQQLDPLAGLGVPITKAVLDKEKWEAFWDAPLNLPGIEGAHNNTTPPQKGVLDQPGLPRQATEINRSSVRYRITGCSVKTDGARIEVSFAGATLGVFSGRLQFTFYRGTNLIRQELVARTMSPSVAYKYDAGLGGLPGTLGVNVLWTDLDKQPQVKSLGGQPTASPITLRTTDRIVVAELGRGAIAVMPPPHTFFWARETSYNLGYNWYRLDRSGSLAIGVRQAEIEEPPAVENRGTEDRAQNFALKSARPGTWQRMPIYLYVTPGSSFTAHRNAAAFTRDDRFKALPGYQVMAAHFHMNVVARARAAGGLGAKVPDLEVLKAAGINIAAPIDGGGGFVASLAKGGDPALNGDDPKWLQWSRGLGAIADDPARGGIAGLAARAPARTNTPADMFKTQADYYETARLQSSSTFVLMPNAEMIRGDVTRELGGHTDMMVSRPLFWHQGRTPGQPLTDKDPTYGTVYHVETAADLMEMARRENLLFFMPHPRTKGSAGYPDAIKDTAPFLDPNYRGVGFRWGMGLDGSETRLCEYRCLPLFDDMNNWVADKNTPPKYMQAISEFYQQADGDDIYANNPVNYMKISALPAPGDWSPIVNAFKTGDFFVTSGEVLITNYAVQGSGATRTIRADVEWTFPLDFVEVVWGDGVKTNRQIISVTDGAPHGSRHFDIPFDATGKKWVRFAAWDSAGNGAFVQPVKLNGVK